MYFDTLYSLPLPLTSSFMVQFGTPAREQVEPEEHDPLSDAFLPGTTRSVAFQE